MISHYMQHNHTSQELHKKLMYAHSESKKLVWPCHPYHWTWKKDMHSILSLWWFFQVYGKYGHDDIWTIQMEKQWSYKKLQCKQTRAICITMGRKKLNQSKSYETEWVRSFRPNLINSWMPMRWDVSSSCLQLLFWQILKKTGQLSLQ
jgi:hypothetical protein